MGLNSRSGGSNTNKTYFGVYQNNIVLEYDKEEDLIKKVEFLGLDEDKIKVRQRMKGKNEGKDVFYYVINDVEGLMTNAYIKEFDFGDFLEIELTDVDDVYVISLGDVGSRQSKDFARRLGNLDLSKEVVFGLWHISADEAENGKAKSGVKMYQDDTKVEYFLKYEDMPEPIQKKKGRKVVWDFDDQEAFLYDTVSSFIEDNFKGDGKVESNDSKDEDTTPPKPKRASRAKSTPVQPVDDDLPF